MHSTPVATLTSKAVRRHDSKTSSAEWATITISGKSPTRAKVNSRSLPVRVETPAKVPLTSARMR
ncbi:hypothetical protein D3C85_1595100 [compost metagenome]